MSIGSPEIIVGSHLLFEDKTSELNFRHPFKLSESINSGVKHLSKLCRL